jgi:hypothetical protein
VLVHSRYHGMGVELGFFRPCTRTYIEGRVENKGGRRKLLYEELHNFYFTKYYWATQIK